MFAVFGEFDRVAGVGFVLEEAVVALVPPDDLAVGIAYAGAGANLLHGVGLVPESNAGILLTKGNVHAEAAVAGVRKLSSYRHAVRLGLRSGLGGRRLGEGQARGSQKEKKNAEMSGAGKRFDRHRSPSGDSTDSATTIGR